jgi:hypothetical protein
MIIPIAEHFGGKGKPDSVKSVVAMPEKWLMNLNMFPSYGMGMMIPSTVVSRSLPPHRLIASKLS